MNQLTFAFNILNPPATWREGTVACPGCKKDVKVAAPNEVKGTEWRCPFCGKWFVILVKDSDFVCRE